MTEALFISLQEACQRHVRGMHLCLVSTDMKFAVKAFKTVWLNVRLVIKKTGRIGGIEPIKIIPTF